MFQIPKLKLELISKTQVLPIPTVPWRIFVVSIGSQSILGAETWHMTFWCVLFVHFELAKMHGASLVGEHGHQQLEQLKEQPSSFLICQYFKYSWVAVIEWRMDSLIFYQSR